MKIIDLAICVNNVDPKGIGRIRCVRYDDYQGEKERAVQYETWDDNDPFVAIPFLPTNINLIPEIGQTVKVINYNTEKTLVNQEYIAGPFTTMYDFNSQEFTQQNAFTSYGVAIKKKKDIREKTGEYKQLAKNTFANDRDYAIYGRYGSDVLFTENGLQLRGGKLKSKENLSTSQLRQLISFPLTSKKSSNLYLKKFPKKNTIVNETITEQELVHQTLKTVIEYEITDLTGTGTTSVNFYVYNVNKPYGFNVYDTNYFGESTELDMNNVKLINTDNTTVTPTLTFTGVSFNDVASLIRITLSTIQTENNLRDYNTLYTEDQTILPTFYRPAQTMKIRMSELENTNKTTLFNKIKLSRTGPYYGGLIWSQDRFSPPTKTITKTKQILKESNNNEEQTFGALKSDRIYFLSTDLNNTAVDFDNFNPTVIDTNIFDKYELSQEDYIKNIEPNTYASVRGESLLKFLRALYESFYTHIHQINEPYIKIGNPDHEKLQKLFNTLENDILNKSIRIN